MLDMTYAAVARSPRRGRASVGPDSMGANDDVLLAFCVPFGVITQALGGLHQFSPGCFTAALRRRQNIPLIINHADTSPVIASVAEHTLAVWETPAGLMARLDPPTTPVARHVLMLAREGRFVGISLAFRKRTSAFILANGVIGYTDVDIVDLSLVPRGVVPGFPTTWVSATTLGATYALGAPRRGR